MTSVPPLLPHSYTSAYISYWEPMDRTRFISSGTVWFDYTIGCYRIDGLFNPWDVQGTQQHLWMCELCNYGEGVSHQYKLIYDRRHDGQAVGNHSIAARELISEIAPSDECILPQNYLREAHGRLEQHESKLFGMSVDAWTLAEGNRLGIRRLFLRRESNEPVRMEQEKRTGIVIRDFPNLVCGPLARELFEPKNAMQARQLS